MLTSFKSQDQKTLFLLCWCGFVEKFAHFGLFTILVLSLKQKFHLQDGQAFALFGLFISLSYATLLFGGFSADRWLGTRRALLLGGVLVMLGNLSLSANHMTIFYLGLATIVIGLALFNVNCVSCVGMLYKEDGFLRQKAYTLYYTGANIGAIISPVIFGYLGKNGNWSWCFYLNTLLLATTLVLLMKNTLLKSLSAKISRVNPWIYVLLPVLCLLGTSLYLLPSVGQAVLIALFAANILFFLYLIYTQKGTARKSILGIFLLNVFSVFFFTCSFQVLSSITLFVERNIPRDIWGMTIPTTVFSALGPLFLVLMAPFFVWFWKRLSRAGFACHLSTKILTGILCAAFAFFLLFLSAKTSVSTEPFIPILLVVLANFLLGAGEICIVPPIFSAISEFSPEKLKSTMIGSWYFFVAIAGYLAGKLSQLSDYDTLHGPVVNTTLSAQIYAHAFLTVSILTFVLGFCVFSLRGVLLRLLKGEENPVLEVKSAL